MPAFLMIPLVGFLPPSDERVAATVELAVISTFGLLATFPPCF